MYRPRSPQRHPESVSSQPVGQLRAPPDLPSAHVPEGCRTKQSRAARACIKAHISAITKHALSENRSNDAQRPWIYILAGVDTLGFVRHRAMARNFSGQIALNPAGERLKLDELTINTSGDYTRIGALLQNIAYMTQSIQQLQVASISYINFAGLISIGALTVGIIKPVPLVEIFAPYGLSIIFIFLIQLYTDIERLTTIKEALEQHANSQMPAPAFLGLNDLSSKYRGRKSVRLIAVLLAIPLALFGYHSIGAMATLARPPKQLQHLTEKAFVSPAEQHLHLMREIFQYINYAGLGFCLLVIVWASCEMLLARRDALREVKDTLGEPPQAHRKSPKIGSSATEPLS
jgi:hypothetical protein